MILRSSSFEELRQKEMFGFTCAPLPWQGSDDGGAAKPLSRFLLNALSRCTNQPPFSFFAFLCYAPAPHSTTPPSPTDEWLNVSRLLNKGGVSKAAVPEAMATAVPYTSMALSQGHPLRNLN